MRVTFPLYAGGFLGPFGGAMLTAIIPNVAEGLDTSLTLVGAAITAYMIPFAVLQLVSGTVAERLGARRVVRASYVVFGLSALACALAPGIWFFLGARAVMGASNAFLSPILLAALSEVVAPEVLGRTVGTFAAWQTAGLTFAPAIGGALGEISWRLAFVAVTVVALVLAVPKRTLGVFEGREGSASLRGLLNRWIGLLSAKAALGYLGFTAIGFLIALVAAEEFDLGSGTRGLLVAGYGDRRNRVRPLRRDGRRPVRPALDGVLGRARVRRRRARPRLRAECLDARAPLARDRLRRHVRLGRAEHDRGRVVPAEPRRARRRRTPPSSSPASRSRRSSTCRSSTRTPGRRSSLPAASQSRSQC